MIQTTFRKLHEAGACTERYRFLAKALGGIKTYGKDTPITLLQILDINGLDDALWALRACDDAEKFSRLLACDYAEHVLPIFETRYPDDYRPREAIAVSRRYARGEATDAELTAARTAAWAAALHAAWAAAGDAARSAAGDAARPAAWYAARPAARSAWADARTAAWAAARSAARSAWADARTAAWAAARSAELQWQEQRLREVLKGVA